MKIRVQPNSKEQSCFTRGGLLVVRVKAKPLDGKANKEAEQVVSAFFGKKARIVKGFKSREKEITFE
jgi:uncharacterized protein (TIGR00251 family)